MKLLIVDTDAVGLDIAMRAAAYGHEVRWWYAPEHGEKRPYGRRMEEFTIVDEWEPSVEWADLIFPTGNDKHMGRLSIAAQEGATVYGPSWQSAQLETNREWGMRVAKAAGLYVPEYQTFSDFDEAIAYVKKKDAAFVAKPYNHADKALSYVAKSPKDLVWKLEQWKRCGKDFGEFVLQEKVDGIEVGVSRWMGREGWVGPPNENFEFKKLMPGDLGVNTGETGTAMKYVRRSRLFEEVLKPLEGFLRAIQHLGDIDVNCIVTRKGPAFLEFTARPGWPAFSIMQSEHLGDPVEWMMDAAMGKDSLEVCFEHAIGLVVWFGPWPYAYGQREDVEGIPLWGIEDRDLPSLHFHAVMRGTNLNDQFEEEEGWQAVDEYLLVATGLGATVRVAKDEAEGLARRISSATPCSPTWRNDIGGEKTKESLEKLQAKGYCRDWRY